MVEVMSGGWLTSSTREQNEETEGGCKQSYIAPCDTLSPGIYRPLIIILYFPKDLPPPKSCPHFIVARWIQVLPYHNNPQTSAQSPINFSNFRLANEPICLSTNARAIEVCNWPQLAYASTLAFRIHYSYKLEWEENQAPGIDKKSGLLAYTPKQRYLLDQILRTSMQTWISPRVFNLCNFI